MAEGGLDSKIHSVFGNYAVDKGLISRLGVSGDDRHVPSYVLDWIVTYAAKSGGKTSDLQGEVEQFIQNHLPPKGEKERVKYRLSQGNTLTLLDAVSVEVKLGNTVEYYANLPCLDERRARIDSSLLAKHEGLLQGSNWGAVQICHDPDADGSGIRIIDFKPMQAGVVSIQAFLECRKAFTVEEWIDVLIRTIGYEPSQYSEEEKLWLLCRLIPIVHNRVNMMELAPPGSGKSYVYNNVSRYVWLTAAEISPAVLFYNRARRSPGILTKYDLLVLDEAQSIRFTNAAEIQAQLKGYLEQGVYSRGDVTATAECGMMLLANIELIQNEHEKYKCGSQKYLPAKPDFIRRLPEVFLESPLLDRFHGIIPGWEIPPFQTDQQANGYGLKADYFAEVCHALRSMSSLSQGIRSHLGLSGGKRDCTAIERLSCGLSKLLLIDATHPRFDELVYEPASKLRLMVRSQLNAIDPQGYAQPLQMQRVSADAPPATELGKIGHYVLLDEIGKGGMARVFKCLDEKQRTIVALKMVTTDGQVVNEAAIRREIDVYGKLKLIQCTNLLEVRDIFQEGPNYALVTEYADGGNLWELMEPAEGCERSPLDINAIKDVASSLLTAIKAMHDNDLVHRDIKPQNILRCDDRWKLADFGISKEMSAPVTGYTFQGAHTAPWAPPEQIEGAPAHPSADVYAYGRVICFLHTGSTDKQAVLTLPQDWRELIQDCTEIDMTRRPDAAGIGERLKDLI